MNEKPVSILFVCLGNICRSPLAEGVFRAVIETRGKAALFNVDSAGTGGWHIGSAPDPRSTTIAARHGVDIAGQKARKVHPQDFTGFDLILGMDQSNIEDLRLLAPVEALPRIHLYLDFATGRMADVPDPYYGGPDGFADVYRIIREASEALAEKLASRRSALTSGHASSIT